MLGQAHSMLPNQLTKQIHEPFAISFIIYHWTTIKLWHLLGMTHALLWCDLTASIDLCHVASKTIQNTFFSFAFRLCQKRRMKPLVISNLCSSKNVWCVLASICSETVLTVLSQIPLSHGKNEYFPHSEKIEIEMIRAFLNQIFRN